MELICDILLIIIGNDLGLFIMTDVVRKNGWITTWNCLDEG